MSEIDRLMSSDRFEEASRRLRESLAGYRRIAIIGGVWFWEPIGVDVPVEEWDALTAEEVERASASTAWFSEPIVLP